MTRIVLTRHAEALHNTDYSLWQSIGVCDAFGLTLNGVRQAEKKAQVFLEKLDKNDFLTIMHSTAIRSKQTASLIAHIASDHGFTFGFASDESFNETPVVKAGDRSGFVRIPSNFSYDRFIKDPTYSAVSTTVDGSRVWTESFEDRVKLLLDHIPKYEDYLWTFQRGGKRYTILVVSHMNAINAFICALDWRALPEPSRFESLAEFCKQYVGVESLCHEEFLEFELNDEGRLYQVRRAPSARDAVLQGSEV
jgi:broad specificity phosphatase PhoE